MVFPFNRLECPPDLGLVSRRTAFLFLREVGLHELVDGEVECGPLGFVHAKGPGEQIPRPVRRSGWCVVKIGIWPPRRRHFDHDCGYPGPRHVS